MIRTLDGRKMASVEISVWPEDLFKDEKEQK
jgi:hypothetical protein